MPTIPVSAAGWRMEPPVSVPIPNGTWYAATAAADPPLLDLRLLAPVVVVSTVVVFWTGVALWVAGNSPGWLGRSWLSWHKLSFIVWIFATGIHVLAYIVRAGNLGLADLGRPIRGALTRQGLLAAGLVAGLVLALVMMKVPTPFLVPFDR